MSDSKSFTTADVAQHHTPEDVYIIIHGGVYNVTKFAPDHPGGGDILMSVAGQDGTEGFDDIGHSSEAKTQMKDMLIGRIQGASEQEPTAPEEGQAATGSRFDARIILRLLRQTMMVAVVLFFALVVIGYYSDDDGE